MFFSIFKDVFLVFFEQIFLLFEMYKNVEKRINIQKYKLK